jgi:8-oxo-dGTP pyrophosphatase MutT (NUDIX family)
MPAIHPKPDSKGTVVTILNPSRPTGRSSWTDPSRVARATPDQRMPAIINGIPIMRAMPPTGCQGWEELVVARSARSTKPLRTGKKQASAGAVVVEPDRRVWLVEPTNGFWGYVRTFPKGTETPGYSLAATAAKEVFEETGLLVEIGPPLIDVERSKSVCRYFLACRIDGDPSDMGWESQAVCLVPLAELSKMLPSRYDRPMVKKLMRTLKARRPPWRPFQPQFR